MLSMCSSLSYVPALPSGQYAPRLLGCVPSLGERVPRDCSSEPELQMRTGKVSQAGMPMDVYSAARGWERHTWHSMCRLVVSHEVTCSKARPRCP